MKLLVDPEEVWYEIYIPDIEGEKIAVEGSKKAELWKTVSRLYEEQVEKYQEMCKRNMSPADRNWSSTVLKKGTLGDRITAISLQIREAPFFGLGWIGKLMEMTVQDSRHESYLAMETLKNVFVLILPPFASKNKMLGWKSRNVSDKKEVMGSRALLLIYFEDVLLKYYRDYLKVVEIMLHDQVSHGRERAMRIVFDLAVAYKAVCTESLLALLVNKLGDSERKIASRAVYYLQMVIEKHEELTLSTAKLVSDQLMKATWHSGPGDKLAFYGMTFYSQIRLGEESPDVTKILLGTYQHYLQIFLTKLSKGKAKEVVKKRRVSKMETEKDSMSNEDDVPRTIKVVLTGLTRAIPFARFDGLKEYAEGIMAISDRIKSFPILLQACMLIFRIFNQEDSQIKDTVLLTKMISNRLLNSSRMAMTTSYHSQLFKFLYKITESLGASTCSEATTCLRDILKSLLAAATIVASPAFAAATLLLLSEALSMKPALRLALIFPDDQMDNAENKSEMFWELLVLRGHFHPTVSRYARTLLQPKGEIDIGQEPDDPFQSMSNSVFLESFIKGSLQVQ